MKITGIAFLLLITMMTARADLLFSDNLNYPNGMIETDGVWFAYSPATPHQDAFVTNDLLVLNESNYDAVAAPFTNNAAPSVVYASFTINVSELPSTKGGYFSILSDGTNDVAHIFINAENTVVPGTYRLGVANFATSITAAGATNFPLDLATGVTYQVVYSWDETAAAQGATLWVNPASANDSFVYANDTTANTYLQNLPVSQIGFSQYANQGVASIGQVMVGTEFTDVVTNVPQIPVIGIQPQSSTNYAFNNVTLYVAASGMGQLAYQWLSNNVPLIDDGANVIGSSSNVLTLNNLQTTANYSVTVGNTAGSVTSSNAILTIITTPTLPFFTVQPQNQTNSLFTTASLTALADGTGPLTYQWYFEPTNGSSFTALSGQTSTNLSLPNLGYANAGSYFVTASGGAGSANSATSAVVVIPPITVSIAQLHALMQTNNSGSYSIGLGQYVTASGRVTVFGPFSGPSSTASEFYIQDGTGGMYVYGSGYGTNAVPAPGALVTITAPCQVYSGQLEIDPVAGSVINGVTNGVVVSNTPPVMPTPQPGNFSLLATNPLSAAGIDVQCALVTFTNIYIYGTKTGGAYTGNGGIFHSNSYTSLYITQGPYSSPNNTNYMELYVPAYGNGSISTNFWGNPVPSHVYQLTGVMANYHGASELDVTRYDDFVVNTPTNFPVSLSSSNGSSLVTWPTTSGATYTVYSATNLMGPWSQVSGLGYYPTTGDYLDTNSAPAKFYRISTP